MFQVSPQRNIPQMNLNTLRSFRHVLYRYFVFRGGFRRTAILKPSDREEDSEVQPATTKKTPAGPSPEPGGLKLELESSFSSPAARYVRTGNFRGVESSCGDRGLAGH